jgi:4-amino-4-deoxy-L-arabinose transferase-like glycosyltransferase
MSTTTFPRPQSSRDLRAAAGGRAAQRLRGRVLTGGWARVGLLALLLGTAVAYTWNLTSSGDANSFYAAAVQAGTKSWKAFFFGSIDSSSFITVDKPPASLWVMALSGRIFGFSSLSMLLPQVLEGVLAVGLLYAAVARWFGARAGLIAGFVLALTPVAALMFRFNNPDALLVCLLVASAYAVTRALERASTRWVVAAGALIGAAFLAKMMQAFLVLPAFGLVYLWAAPTSLRRRVAQLAAGAGAIAVSAGWWVAVVALWPAGSRPMIDGSSDNSVVNLILGYNGLGRIFGASGPGGGGGGANFSGQTGLLRLFNDLMGGQASWLLPAALLALGLGLWSSRRAPRTDRTRAAMILWGGWLVVSGLVFSLGSGVIHTYYTVALAPAIGALVAIGAESLWRRRHEPAARGWLAVAVAGTAIWAWVLLDRTPTWEPWLRVAIVICGAAAAAGLLWLPARAWRERRVARTIAVLGAVACLAAPLAYTAQTIGTAHTGSVPSAGPSSAGEIAGGGLGGASGAGAPGEFAGGRSFARPATSGGPPRGGSAGRQAGGQTGGVSASSALVKALEAKAGRYRWVAAVSGSQSAASLELATDGEPVMAIGGFNGQGGQLSLAQFKAYVAAGQIHYYVVSGGGMGATPGGGGSTTRSITSWVQSHFRSETIGGQTVYDLTS